MDVNKKARKQLDKLIANYLVTMEIDCSTKAKRITKDRKIFVLLSGIHAFKSAGTTPSEKYQYLFENSFSPEAFFGNVCAWEI